MFVGVFRARGFPPSNNKDAEPSSGTGDPVGTVTRTSGLQQKQEAEPESSDMSSTNTSATAGSVIDCCLPIALGCLLAFSYMLLSSAILGMSLVPLKPFHTVLPSSAVAIWDLRQRSQKGGLICLIFMQKLSVTSDQAVPEA